MSDRRTKAMKTPKTKPRRSLERMVRPPADVLKSIRKAYRLAKRASDACADADSMVATYWKTDGVSITPNHWDTRHLRDAAGLVHSLAHAMWVKTEGVMQRPNDKLTRDAGGATL